jgi:hypothetical protein
MITHAPFVPCANPVPLAHLLSIWACPPDFTPTMCVRAPGLLGEDDRFYVTKPKVVYGHDRIASSIASFKRRREARFSKVMAGKGAMYPADIAMALHSTRDNIGQSLRLLVNDGAVERTGAGTATRYEWVKE